MRQRSALVSEIQQLLAGERADPRPAQGVFLIPVALELVLRVFSGVPLDRFFGFGSLIAAIATIGAIAIGTGGLRKRWTVWLPVLDIVALAVYRESPGTALGVAVAFPAIWLGLQFGRRGVMITTAMMLATFVIPSVGPLGLTTEGFSRVSQLTMMAIICAAAVAGTAEVWQAQAEKTQASTTRLERAMRDVIEQRRLTESIVTSVDVGLIALDAGGAYDSMNPRHRDFMALAYPDGHEGLAGQTGYVYGPDGTTLLESEDMPTIRAVRGEVLHDVLIWVGKDPAERRALAVSSTPHYTSEGVFAGAVLAYHDITELVLASRIKEEFVASVSHELRTPLTSIIGYVDVILDDTDELPEEVRHYLGTVQRNARRLHRLVDDLLSTALQSVASVLDVQEVSISQLLHLCALEAAKSAASAGLEFRLEDTSEPVDLSVNGDGERLTQVFDNLFSNAVKYTPTGGCVVGGLRRDGDDAVVWVSDNGRGIAASELDEVFTKFFRSRAVQTDAIPGVGLGLAISKTIVDAHGGTITCTSELGRGSTFEVRLPLARVSREPAAASGAA